METRGKSYRHTITPMALVAVILIALMVPAAQAAGASQNADEDGKGRVVPVNVAVGGSTYGEWSARWVQWWLSIPAATNPVIDTTGANCAEGQSGPVWFLVGTTGGFPVTRLCTVPAGKALFFPLVNGVFGSGIFDCEPTVPGVVCNLATLRAAAAASMDEVTLTAEIDGKALKKLTDQRVTSPAFAITYPDGNLFGVDAGTYNPQVTDGYWLMVSPPSAGAHTIHFKADITGGVFAGTVVEATYNLTIGP